MARIVDVLVPVALDHAYSYRAPDDLALAVGDIVAVPLGPREAVGVVWADNVAVQPGLHNRLKDVEARLDYLPLNDAQIVIRSVDDETAARGESA